MYPEDADTVEGLLAEADAAMYDAKRRGGDGMAGPAREEPADFPEGIPQDAPSAGPGASRAAAAAILSIAVTVVGVRRLLASEQLQYTGTRTLDEAV